MIIYLGTDHAGFELKEKLKAYLQAKEHIVIDKGAYELTPGDDYPDFIAPVAQAISDNADEARGIIFGWSGEGEAMLANRFSHVRAAVYYGGTFDVIELSRKHNDANVLSLGAHFITPEQGKAALDVWLATAYEGGRHVARLQKMEEARDLMEAGKMNQAEVASESAEDPQEN